LGVVGVLVEARAGLGALLNVLGDRLRTVHTQEDSGFTGEEFEFLVALAGAGPALVFLELDALLPGGEGLGVPVAADAIVLLAVLDGFVQLVEVLTNCTQVKGIEPVLQGPGAGVEVIIEEAVAATGLHGETEGGVVAVALPLGNVAFGVGEDLAVARTQFEAEGFEVVFEGDRKPKAGDGCGQGQPQVEATARAATADQDAGEADALQAVEDEG